jgi:excisionase family DNA binding protein
MEKLLRVSDVADLLNVKPQTVYHWTKKDYLVAIKLGSRLRFRQADIQRFIDDHNTTPVQVDAAGNVISEVKS